MLSEAVRICSDADMMKFTDLFDEKGYLLITSHNNMVMQSEAEGIRSDADIENFKDTLTSKVFTYHNP